MIICVFWSPFPDKFVGFNFFQLRFGGFI
uniref:Uncharacterized protein n=1 Tax=Rhizophora mucronata TaxID=61149 RepID=A0A2P2QAE5_RHIMU